MPLSFKALDPHTNTDVKVMKQALAAADTIQCKNILKLKPCDNLPNVYSSGMASKVEAFKSLWNIPMHNTGKDVNKVLNILKDQGSYKEVPENIVHLWYII